MLVVRSLWGHAIALVRLTVHALFPSTSSKRTAVSTLTPAVSELRVVCKILFIISTDVVEHRPFAPICMVTYLVHIRLIVSVGIVRMTIRISTMLTTALPLRLLLLLRKHVGWLIRLTLTRQGWIWGGASACLRITRLSIATKRRLLSLACRVLGALLGS